MSDPLREYDRALRAIEAEIESGQQPSEEMLSIQSYETYGGGCDGTSIPTGDSSFLNGIPTPSSPSTGWDKIDDDVDDPDLDNFVTFTMSEEGIQSDTFNASGIQAWPTSGKVRICCNDTGGGASSGQWNQCSWKSADNKTIGTSAIGDLPSIVGDDVVVHELDLIIATNDPTADLSSTKIQLRLINGNTCEVNVFAAEVEYTAPCPCENEVELRPVSGGYMGPLIGEDYESRSEAMAGNNFTDSSYANYVRWNEDVGAVEHNPSDGYTLDGLDTWPTAVSLRLRVASLGVATSAGVRYVQWAEANGNLIASWGTPDDMAYEPFNALTTLDLTMTVEPYTEFLQEFADLSSTTLTIRYGVWGFGLVEADLRQYAIALDVIQDCPDSVVGIGGVLAGGSHSKTTTFAPVGSGGVLVGGESYVLAGMIGSGGCRGGGSASVYGTTNFTGTGGMKLSGKQYQYRRTITVPAGKVSQDFESFYLGVVAQIDPAKVGTGFFVTSAAGPEVPYEVRSFVDGKLSLWVRTPLKTASDTVLYLYYGAT